MAGELRVRLRKRVIRFGKRMRPRLDVFLAAQSRAPNEPVLDAAAFSFIAAFERNWLAIKREFDQIYKMRNALPAFHEISPDQKRISKG